MAETACSKTCAMFLSQEWRNITLYSEMEPLQVVQERPYYVHELGGREEKEGKAIVIVAANFILV